MAVLVLQALAVERRAAGGAAEQEAARPAVAGRPREVADPLEAEHRVEDVERDHRHAVVGVRRRRGDPGGERARLVDALLEDLALLVLAVEHQLLGVLGLVELADLAEDPELAEHALHAERARLVGHDRHDVAGRSACRAAARRGSARRPSSSRSRARRCPSSWRSKADSSGTGSAIGLAAPRRQRRRRAPRAARAGSVISGESSAGCRRRTSSTCSSVRSQARSGRGTRSSAFSVIFFCWWVMFWPSPASPIP